MLLLRKFEVCPFPGYAHQLALLTLGLGKKFEVKYVPNEALKQDYVDNLAGFVYQLDNAILQDKFDVRCNVEGLPNPMLMEEFLKLWWN